MTIISRADCVDALFESFEFMNIDKVNHQELTKAIYHIQRQFLQNR